MIIVVSNRNVAGADPNSTEKVVGDEKMFGDDFNAEGGANELRVATAKKTDKKWEVTLLPDKSDKNGTPATEQLFEETIQEIRAGNLSKNWVVFIHGFNQSFKKNLGKCKEIEDYGVNVIALSWPSNPGPNGGFVISAAKKKRREYRNARANARLSVTAVDRFIERIVRYVHKSVEDDCPISLSLLVHSLGNYLFQQTVEGHVFTNDLSIFDNIILNAADVDARDHAAWLDLLDDAKRVYVTINEMDSVLKISTLVNGRRLGNTAYQLDADLPVYMDFTFGDDVGIEHRLFRPRVKNPVIKKFYSRALNGKRAETIDGLVLNHGLGAYQLENRPGENEDIG